MRYLVLLLAVGCQSTPPAVECPPPAPAVAPALAMFNTLVAEDGTVMWTFDDVSHYEVAMPIGPHRFQLGDRVIDTAARSIAKVQAPVEFADIGDQRSELIRYDPDGHVRWKIPLDGVRSVRPPDVATGGGRVVATIDNVVHAFDDVSSVEIWHAPIEGSSLHVAGDTLFSIDCNEPTHDHWLYGNALSDGHQLFRAELTTSCDPRVTVDATGKHVVVADEHAAETRIFDLHGRLLARLGEVAQATYPLADSTLVVTDKHVMMLDPTGAIRWQSAGLANDFVGGDQLATLPGGDVIIANYAQISDDGVDTIRIRPATGATVWRTRVPGLGVGHSEYLQDVYLELRGDDVFVVSQASGGGFFEKLATATGKRELRCANGSCVAVR